MLKPALLTTRSQSQRALLRVFKEARHLISGRFRARTLVGSGRYSKYFFAEDQCSWLMPSFSPEARAAYH
jgi:hypothetical protein